MSSACSSLCSLRLVACLLLKPASNKVGCLDGCWPIRPPSPLLLSSLLAGREVRFWDESVDERAEADEGELNWCCLRLLKVELCDDEDAMVVAATALCSRRCRDNLTLRTTSDLETAQADADGSWKQYNIHRLILQRV